MSWFDELRPASFRGVPFFVERGPRKLGRRLAVHDYIGRDDAYAEDLGGIGQSFTIEAFVVGDDALTAAKALADALEKPGPGTLVHPWLGEFTVAAGEVTQSFDVRESLLVRFSIPFTRTVEVRYPAAAVDHAEKIDVAASAAKTSLLDDLRSTLTVDNLQDFVLGDAAYQFTAAVGDVRDALAPAIEVAEAGAAYAAAARDAIAGAAGLIANPLAAGQRVLGLLDLGNLTGSGSLVQTALGITRASGALVTAAGALPSWLNFSRLFGWSPSASPSAGGSTVADAIPLTTPSRLQQAANRAAITDLVRTGAVIEAARAATREEFSTREDALAAGEALMQAIDDRQDTASPETYRALAVLRAAVVAAISEQAPELPRLVTVTPAATMPAIAVAWRQFGDDPAAALAASDALVARNRVAHPLFVMGGESLQMVVS